MPDRENPINGNYYDSNGVIRNLDGDLPINVKTIPWNGNFYDHLGQVKNIDEIFSGGGGANYGYNGSLSIDEGDQPVDFDLSLISPQDPPISPGNSFTDTAGNTFVVQTVTPTPTATYNPNANGIPYPPSDNKLYGMKNKNWTEVNSTNSVVEIPQSSTITGGELQFGQTFDPSKIYKLSITPMPIYAISFNGSVKPIILQTPSGTKTLTASTPQTFSSGDLFINGTADCIFALGTIASDSSSSTDLQSVLEEGDTAEDEHIILNYTAPNTALEITYEEGDIDTGKTTDAIRLDTSGRIITATQFEIEYASDDKVKETRAAGMLASQNGFFEAEHIVDKELPGGGVVQDEHKASLGHTGLVVEETNIIGDGTDTQETSKVFEVNGAKMSFEYYKSDSSSTGENYDHNFRMDLSTVTPSISSDDATKQAWKTYIGQGSGGDVKISSLDKVMRIFDASQTKGAYDIPLMPLGLGAPVIAIDNAHMDFTQVVEITDQDQWVNQEFRFTMNTGTAWEGHTTYWTLWMFVMGTVDGNDEYSGYPFLNSRDQSEWPASSTKGFSTNETDASGLTMTLADGFSDWFVEQANFFDPANSQWYMYVAPFDASGNLFDLMGDTPSTANEVNALKLVATVAYSEEQQGLAFVGDFTSTIPKEYSGETYWPWGIESQKESVNIIDKNGDLAWELPVDASVIARLSNQDYKQMQDEGKGLPTLPMQCDRVEIRLYPGSYPTSFTGLAWEPDKVCSLSIDNYTSDAKFVTVAFNSGSGQRNISVEIAPNSTVQYVGTKTSWMTLDGDVGFRVVEIPATSADGTPISEENPAWVSFGYLGDSYSAMSEGFLWKAYGLWQPAEKMYEPDFSEDKEQIVSYQIECWFKPPRNSSLVGQMDVAPTIQVINEASDLIASQVSYLYGYSMSWQPNYDNNWGGWWLRITKPGKYWMATSRMNQPTKNYIKFPLEYIDKDSAGFVDGHPNWLSDYGEATPPGLDYRQNNAYYDTAHLRQGSNTKGCRIRVTDPSLLQAWTLLYGDFTDSVNPKSGQVISIATGQSETFDNVIGVDGDVVVNGPGLVVVNDFKHRTAVLVNDGVVQPIAGMTNSVDPGFDLNIGIDTESLVFNVEDALTFGASNGFEIVRRYDAEVQAELIGELDRIYTRKRGTLFEQLDEIYSYASPFITVEPTQRHVGAVISDMNDFSFELIPSSTVQGRYFEPTFWRMEIENSEVSGQYVFEMDLAGSTGDRYGLTFIASDDTRTESIVIAYIDKTAQTVRINVPTRIEEYEGIKYAVWYWPEYLQGAVITAFKGNWPFKGAKFEDAFTLDLGDTATNQRNDIGDVLGSISHGNKVIDKLDMLAQKTLMASAQQPNLGERFIPTGLPSNITQTGDAWHKINNVLALDSMLAVTQQQVPPPMYNMLSPAYLQFGLQAQDDKWFVFEIHLANNIAGKEPGIYVYCEDWSYNELIKIVALADGQPPTVTDAMTWYNVSDSLSLLRIPDKYLGKNQKSCCVRGSAIILSAVPNQRDYPDSFAIVSNQGIYETVAQLEEVARQTIVNTPFTMSQRFTGSTVSSGVELYVNDASDPSGLAGLAALGMEDTSTFYYYRVTKGDRTVTISHNLGFTESHGDGTDGQPYIYVTADLETPTEYVTQPLYNCAYNDVAQYGSRLCGAINPEGELAQILGTVWKPSVRKEWYYWQHLSLDGLVGWDIKFVIGGKVSNVAVHQLLSQYLTYVQIGNQIRNNLIHGDLTSIQDGQVLSTALNKRWSRTELPLSWVPPNNQSDWVNWPDYLTEDTWYLIFNKDMINQSTLTEAAQFTLRIRSAQYGTPGHEFEETSIVFGWSPSANSWFLDWNDVNMPTVSVVSTPIGSTNGWPSAFNPFLNMIERDRYLYYRIPISFDLTGALYSTIGDWIGGTEVDGTSFLTFGRLVSTEWLLGQVRQLSRGAGSDRGVVLNAYTPKNVWYIDNVELTASSSEHGTGYAVGDLIFPDSGIDAIYPAWAVVDAVDGTGAVTGLTMSSHGIYESDPTRDFCPTNTDHGGTGLVIDITAQNGPGSTLNDIANPQSNDIAHVIENELSNNEAWSFLWSDRNGDGVFNWVPNQKDSNVVLTGDDTYTTIQNGIVKLTQAKAALIDGAVQKSTSPSVVYGRADDGAEVPYNLAYSGSRLLTAYAYTTLPAPISLEPSAIEVVASVTYALTLIRRNLWWLYQNRGDIDDGLIA